MFYKLWNGEKYKELVLLFLVSILVIQWKRVVKHIIRILRRILPQAGVLITCSTSSTMYFLRFAREKIAKYMLAHERILDVKLTAFIGRCIAHHKSVSRETEKEGRCVCTTYTCLRKWVGEDRVRVSKLYFSRSPWKAPNTNDALRKWHCTLTEGGEILPVVLRITMLLSYCLCVKLLDLRTIKPLNSEFISHKFIPCF